MEMLADQPPDCTSLIEQTRAWPAKEAPDDEHRRFWDLFSQRIDCERLSQAGWSPIEQVAKQDREVRRASFEDGWRAYRIPAVALERGPDGQVELRLSIDRPSRVYRALVTEEIWREALAKDEAARKPPPPPRVNPAATLDIPEIPPSCHGWSVTLETADDGKAWSVPANQCREGQDAALDYGFWLAHLAIDRIAQCAPARAEMASKPATVEAPLWALISCAGRVGPKFLD